MSINKLVKVKDQPNLLRDINSKGILNADYNGLLEYKQAKEKRAIKNNTLSQCEDDINRLKEEVTDIKDSLKLILERLTPKD
tara:strand:+ start:277 stop:522 length:246 start_codon:yes stop_codon:yes gene_type:complete